MKPISTADLAVLLGGVSHVDAVVTGFATDHGEVKPGDAFLAIKGQRVDGEDFAEGALAAGASAVVVEKRGRARALPKIVVPNLVSALAQMAVSFRATFSGPVVGITGSAGKTTTKEFLAAALGKKVLKTVGNRNTEYTAPLLWAELKGDEDAVVVEMSMRGPGQITHLCSFSKPTAGIITNIGPSHLETVGSLEGVATAKSELLQALPSDGFAVLPRDDAFYDYLANPTARSSGGCGVLSFGGYVVLSFGKSELSDSRVLTVETGSDFRSIVTGTVFGEAYTCQLPVAGEHMALNAAAALLAARELGIELKHAAAALEFADLPPMRMQRINYRGATIIMDAYNASPASTVAAINTLRGIPTTGKRKAALGEMKELGALSKKGHEEVGKAAANLDEVVFFGEDMKFALEAARIAGASSFRMVDSIAEVTEFIEKLQEGDVALIKGSRGLELERALKPLLEDAC